MRPRLGPMSSIDTSPPAAARCSAAIVQRPARSIERCAKPRGARATMPRLPSCARRQQYWTLTASPRSSIGGSRRRRASVRWRRRIACSRVERARAAMRACLRSAAVSPPLRVAMTCAAARASAQRQPNPSSLAMVRSVETGPPRRFVPMGCSATRKAVSARHPHRPGPPAPRATRVRTTPGAISAVAPASCESTSATRARLRRGIHIRACARPMAPRVTASTADAWRPWHTPAARGCERRGPAGAYGRVAGIHARAL